MIVDWRPALRKMDATAIQAVIEMPGRATVVAGVKSLDIGFAKWREMSSPVSGSVDLNDFDAVVKQATSTRDACRLLIAVRTGLTIYQSKAGHQIETYYNECRTAKATVPKKLKTELGKINKPEGVDVAEDL